MSVNATSLAQDPRFEAFRVDDFDAAKFTSRALSGAVSSAQTTAQQLRGHIQLLEGGVREEVVEKQTELKRVVTDLAEMETSCFAVDRAVQQLGTSVEEIQSSLRVPCQRLRLRTTQLKNLRSTIETLRSVSRRLKLMKKLKKRIGDADVELEGVDLPDVARVIADLHESSPYRSHHHHASEDFSVDAEVVTSNVDALKDDDAYVTLMTKRVRHCAEMKLLKGQESLNQADMGHALHVYFNLKELPSAVDMLVSKRTAKLNHKAKMAFDFHRLSSGNRISGQSSLQESVWSSLRTLIAEMEDGMMAIYHLHQVLAKKHDPVTHVMFLTVVPHGDALVDRFWSQAVGIFERSLTHAVQPGKSTPIREVLVQGFPELCSNVEASLDRLSKRTVEKGKPSSIGVQHLEQLLGSCLSIQNVFVTRSLTHMTDTINGVFPPGSRSVPPSTEIQKVISAFHEEMKQAENSIQTCRLVANNIANAVCSISEKTQMLSATGPELRTISGSCNAAQLRNISLCSSLQDIHKALVTLITKLDQKGIEFLIPACETLRTAALERITPIFKAMIESLEQHLLSMHSLSVWRNATGDAAPSAYLQELRHQLRAFSMEFLARFAPPFSPTTPSFVRSLVKRMGCRLILFFIRHAALVRPLSAYGRQQLVVDAMELENVISQTLISVSILTHHSSDLQSFKELVQISPAEIRHRPNVMELPRSVILHHLFSHASAHLRLPHERSGLTPSQFSFWLDSHTVDEAIQGVQSILDVTSVTSDDGDIRSVLIDLCKP